MKFRYLLLFAGCLIFSACREKESPPDPEMVFPAGYIDGSTYNNKALKLKFTIPEGWKLKEGRPAREGESSVLLVAGINQATFESFLISLNRGFRRTGMSADEKVDHMFRHTRETHKEFRELSRQEIGLGGTPAIQLVYTLDAGRKGTLEKFILAEHLGNTITFACAEPDAPGSDIEKILATVRFY